MFKVMYFTPADEGDTVAEFWHGFDMVAQVEWDGAAYVVVYFEGFDELDVDAASFDALVNKATEWLSQYSGQ